MYLSPDYFSVEPSQQSKAKIALSKADRTVGWTFSAAYRFAQDMICRVDQENPAFYTAGQNSFTDGLLITALLLSYVLILLLGYCIGSSRRRRVASVVPMAVSRATGGGVGNGDQQAAAAGGGVGNGGQPPAAAASV